MSPLLVVIFTQALLATAGVIFTWSMDTAGVAGVAGVVGVAGVAAGAGLSAGFGAAAFGASVGFGASAGLLSAFAAALVSAAGASVFCALSHAAATHMASASETVVKRFSMVMVSCWKAEMVLDLRVDEPARDPYDCRS
jgi:hypothetical protein